MAYERLLYHVTDFAQAARVCSGGGHGLFVRGPRIVRDGDDTSFAVWNGEVVSNGGVKTVLESTACVSKGDARVLRGGGLFGSTEILRKILFH